MSSLQDILDKVRKSEGYLVYKLIGQAAKVNPQCADEMERLWGKIEDGWIKTIEAQAKEIEALKAKCYRLSTLLAEVPEKDKEIMKLVNRLEKIHSDESELHKKAGESRKEIERLKEQRDSAIAYISVCSVDPDIFDSQWESWCNYQQVCHGKKPETIREQL